MYDFEFLCQAFIYYTVIDYAMWLQELGEPNLDRMKLLDSLLTWTRAGKPPSAAQALSKLTKLVGDPVGDSDWALGDALWTAQNLFSQWLVHTSC